MKLLKYLFIVFIITLVVSCNQDSSITSPDHNKDKLYKATDSFGYIVPDNVPFASNINQHTPSNSGWKCISNEAKWTTTDLIDRWNAIENANFNLVMAKFDREWIRTRVIGGSDPEKQEIKDRLADAKRAGATYVVIDDFLTNGVPNREGQTARFDKFTQLEIDTFCSWAQAENLKVAVTEDCVSVYLSGEINTTDNRALYANIDCIMPYGYDDYTRDADGQWVDGLMYNHLYNFYNKIQTTWPSKDLYPILGYNTDYGTSQLGVNSGGHDFIQRASQFASDGVIFYWSNHSDPANNLIALTAYLQNNGYILAQ